MLNTLATGASGRSVSVNLKAVDSAYPLVGQRPARPAHAAGSRPCADGGARRRGARCWPGWASGSATRCASATRTSAIRRCWCASPTAWAACSSLGPRLLVQRDTLDAAQVLLPGALARYEYKLRCRKASTPRPLQRALQRAWPDAGWRARSPRDVQPQITRVTDRLATFLTLAGLTALLSGGLGIALTIETHLARRTATIATLKSLGAGGGQVFAIYLAQVMVLAGAGVVLGLALGVLLPLADPAGAGGHVPDFARSRHLWRPACPRRSGRAAHHVRVRGVAARGRTRDFAGAAVSRARGADAALAAAALSGAAGLAVAGLAGVAIIGVPQPVVGAWFVATVAVAAILLWGLTRLVLPCRASDRPSRRLRAAAGDRQPAPPGLAVAAGDRGAGGGRDPARAVAVLATNLNNEVALRLPSRAPALYLIDMQPDQREVLSEVLREIEGTRLEQMLPSLRARVVRIAGRPVGEVQVADERRLDGQPRPRLDLCGQLPEGSELVAGRLVAGGLCRPAAGLDRRGDRRGLRRRARRHADLQRAGPQSGGAHRQHPPRGRLERRPARLPVHRQSERAGRSAAHLRGGGRRARGRRRRCCSTSSPTAPAQRDADLAARGGGARDRGAGQGRAGGRHRRRRDPGRGHHGARRRDPGGAAAATLRDRGAEGAGRAATGAAARLSWSSIWSSGSPWRWSAACWARSPRGCWPRR